MDRQEEIFLKAIHAQPTERVIRLVYADWLEERNDPRAVFIRLEEEMRQVPIYSDRYWEMKPRRNELRPSMDQAWLESMRYGTDYEPVFRDVPSGWKERWRLIREFIERWHGVPMRDVGGQHERIRQAEEKVGYLLPPSVHEWINLLWELVDGGQSDKVFRDCSSLEEVEGNNAFSLMIQGEGDYHWAVKTESIEEADPAVDGYSVDYGSPTPRGFVHDSQWAPHATSWALGHILTYLDMARGNCFSSEVADTEVLLNRMQSAFPINSQFDKLQIFEAPNILVYLCPTWGGGRQTHLAIHFWKTLTTDEVPDVIKQITGRWSNT